VVEFGGTTTEVSKHVRALYDEHDGQLTAEILLVAATPDSHPLHAHFEWDDSVAATQHRLEQARRLIRSCRVTFAGTDGKIRTVREFHSVVIRDPAHSRTSGLGPAHVRVYRATEDIVKDTTSADALARQFKLEWDMFRKRWENFDEFIAMFGPKK
jgi:hypothetical protein